MPVTAQKPEELKSGCYRDDEGGIFSVMPGHVYFQEIAKPLFDVNAAGLYIPKQGVNDDDHKKSTKRDYYRFGVVVGCGVYQQRGGTILFNFQEYPLPLETLVEHNGVEPQKTMWKDREIQHVTTDCIEGYYLPGKWPTWARVVWEEMKANHKK